MSKHTPVAWWVHDFHIARQPVKARARYPEPTEFLYPASREQDARNASKMLGGKCTPLFAHPAPDDCGRDGNHRWTGPGIGSDRIRCIDCGATKAWEGRS